MNKIVTLIIFSMMFISLHSQDIQLKKVEPPFWWKGMKNPEVQLLYGNNIGKSNVFIEKSGIKIKKEA